MDENTVKIRYNGQVYDGFYEDLNGEDITVINWNGYKVPVLLLKPAVEYWDKYEEQWVTVTGV